MSHTDTNSVVTVTNLRKALKAFNEGLGVYINNEERYKLGRVLTIIDASIADPEQRKAIKDLIQNEWWGYGQRLSEGAMVNPHTDLRALAEALGFTLYEPSNTVGQVPVEDDMSYVVKRYEDVINAR